MAGELTLAQLADLQAYADRNWPDPLEGLRDRLGGMEAEERRLALVAAHALAEAGPPAWGWPADDAGHRHFVLTALAPHNPGFTASDAAGVVASVTAPEYAALWRTARGVTPLDEVEGYLGFDRRDAGGEPITWRQAVVEVCEAFPAYTIERVGRLTIGQVRALRTGGKPELRGVPLRPGADVTRMVREARRNFHGPERGAG